MNIKIKLVKECSKKEYGTCEVVDSNNILIEVSKKKNSKMNQYFVTLLHELIHAWVFIMKANGIKMSDRKEHRWIYSVEAVIIKALEYLPKGLKWKK